MGKLSKKISDLISGRNNKGVQLGGGNADEEDKNDQNKDAKDNAAKAALARLAKNSNDSKMTIKPKIFREEENQIANPPSNINLSKNELIFQCPYCLVKGDLKETKNHMEFCIKARSKNDPDIIVSAFMTFNSKESAEEAALIIKRYLQNIIQNPSESKYRKIKKSNKIFNSKLSSLLYNDELWKYFGFVDYQEPTSEGILESYYILSETHDIKSLENKLLSLDKWEIITPLFYRNIEKFHAKDIVKDVSDESDNFYEVTAQEIKDEIERLRAERAESDQLKCRRTYKCSTNYTHARIRVKFPDNSYIELSILPHEKSMILYDIIRDNLTDISMHFDLFTSGTKQTKIPCNQATISELSLIPRSLIIFKPHSGVIDGSVCYLNML